MDYLGSQIVTVVPRTRVKHGDFVDGEPIDYSGIMLQPIGSDEQIQLGYPAYTERWRIYAPPDFPTSTENALYHNDIRMHVDGNLQLYYDFDGCPDHVTGIVRRYEG